MLGSEVCGFGGFSGFISTPHTRVSSELPAMGVSKPVKAVKPARAARSALIPERNDACQDLTGRASGSDRDNVIRVNSNPVGSCSRSQKQGVSGQRLGQSTPSNAAFPLFIATEQRIANPATTYADRTPRAAR